jgi:hypothetical protein
VYITITNNIETVEPIWLRYIDTVLIIRI